MLGNTRPLHVVLIRSSGAMLRRDAGDNRILGSHVVLAFAGLLRLAGCRRGLLVHGALPSFARHGAAGSGSIGRNDHSFGWFVHSRISTTTLPEELAM